MKYLQQPKIISLLSYFYKCILLQLDINTSTLNLMLDRILTYLLTCPNTIYWINYFNHCLKFQLCYVISCYNKFLGLFLNCVVIFTALFVFSCIKFCSRSFFYSQSFQFALLFILFSWGWIIEYLCQVSTIIPIEFYEELIWGAPG